MRPHDRSPPFLIGLKCWSSTKIRPIEEGEFGMRKKRFGVEQTIGVLQQAEPVRCVAAACLYRTLTIMQRWRCYAIFTKRMAAEFMQ